MTQSLLRAPHTTAAHRVLIRKGPHGALTRCVREVLSAVTVGSGAVRLAEEEGGKCWGRGWGDILIFWPWSVEELLPFWVSLWRCPIWTLSYLCQLVMGGAGDHMCASCAFVTGFQPFLIQVSR